MRKAGFVLVSAKSFLISQQKHMLWVLFVVRQLQEKYLAVNNRLYMAFVDLEKAFDCVPWKVIWWALRKLGVEEWIVQLVQGM